MGLYGLFQGLHSLQAFITVYRSRRAFQGPQGFRRVSGFWWGFRCSSGSTRLEKSGSIEVYVVQSEYGLTRGLGFRV